MRAWVFPSGVRIAPFDDPVGEAWLHEHTLAAERTAVLRELGLEPAVAAPGQEIAGPALVLSDHLYTSRRALGELIDRAPSAGGTAVLALPTATLRALALQDVDARAEDGLTRFDCFYVPQGVRLPDAPGAAGLRAALGAGARPVVATGRTLRLRLGGAGEQGQGEVGAEATLHDAYAMHVRHWVHVHRMNIVSLGVRLLDTVRAHRAWALGAVLMSLSLRRSRWRARLRRRLVRVGPGCDVDPSAHVETSFIGRGVRIGTGCIVKHSFIGDGCVLADGSHVIGSVLGPRCTTLHRTWLVGCVAYPGAFLSNSKVQLSLFGKGANLTGSTFILDRVFDGEVRVKDGDRLVGLGTRFCGACLGHGVTTGAHVTIQAGRAIPNGYRILGPPEATLVRVPEGLPQDAPLVVRDGTLVPLL